ncbi:MULTISPECIES: hypothetical protein [unclassified Variovorax]|mgnify:CR=1 FL=1|jgi:hypothetical protein|uniref:hypothetical protein n=1 Tax=unclassified Variovorax TaxID=663243 RepID=UPI0013E0706C|nr:MULTISPECIES: hypothetical protein [unclassified Variovorax]
MKYLSSFAVTHATVLALMVCVFLMDGCAHRQRGALPGARGAAAPPPLPNIERETSTARNSRP